MSNADTEKILKFKEEINILIDNYINIIINNNNVNATNNDNINNNDNIKYFLPQLISYYERMKLIYDSYQSDSYTVISDISDSDDDNRFLFNNTYLQQNDMYDNDYYFNNYRDYDSIQQNKTKNNFYSVGEMYDGLDNLDKSCYYDAADNNKNYTLSDDNKICDNLDELYNYDTVDNNENYISNNTKKTIKIFISEPDIEILKDNYLVDYYNEPTI